MSFPKLIYSIAVLVIIAWVLSMVFRLAAWLINGLLYVAVLVVIIGLIAQFISQKITAVYSAVIYIITPILLAALDRLLTVNPSSRQHPSRSLERLGSRGH